VVWDLRGEPPYYPLRPEVLQPAFGCINGAEFGRAMGGASYPDQGLLAALLGVDLRAEVAGQTVLSPFLSSLTPVLAAQVVANMSNVDRGFLSAYPSIPWLPIRFMPQGSAARKLGGERRGVVDGGWPRAPLYDGQGIPVVSLNAASLQADWPHENKTDLGQVGDDLATLSAGARAGYQRRLRVH
jgi:hypothetical protein